MQLFFAHLSIDATNVGQAVGTTQRTFAAVDGLNEHERLLPNNTAPFPTSVIHFGESGSGYCSDMALDVRKRWRKCEEVVAKLFGINKIVFYAAICV